MKNKGRLARRIIAVIVCMTLVLAALPTGVFSAFAQTKKGKLKVTSISDIHYFADSEKGTGDTKNGFSEAYNAWNDRATASTTKPTPYRRGTQEGSCREERLCIHPRRPDLQR